MIGEALRLLRVFYGYRQSAVAIKLGLSPNYVSDLERGKRAPSIKTLEQYAKFFKVSPSSIMFFSENCPKARVNKKTRLFIAKKLMQFLQMVEGDKNG